MKDFTIFYKVCKNILKLKNEEIKEIEKRYKEPHRHYHTLDHVADIIGLIEGYVFVFKNLSKEEIDLLYLAAIFHDIVYDPKSKTNEEDSVNVAMIMLNDKHWSRIFLDDLKGIIMATQTHTVFNSLLEKLFCEFDLNGFEKSFSHVLENEQKIRKEYQWVDWSIYKSGRPEILGKFLTNPLLSDRAKENIKMELEYLQFHTPRIAIYPGSFNPFHFGHMNILKKAEEIFDKVIVAVGLNPEKQDIHAIRADYNIEELNYRQVDFYNGLLTDYIKTKNYPVTIIRGLRNTTDMQYELNQFRWLQELMPDIKVVSIFCDKEYEHISSSSIRNIQKYDNNFYQKYMVK